MSTHRYSHKDIVRLANLITGVESGRNVEIHRDSIDKLFSIIEELASMPRAYNDTSVGRATRDFVQSFDKCAKTLMTTDDVKKEVERLPVNVVYLHENKNMIGKIIDNQKDLDELEESTFVQAYWEIRSIGDAIRCLLQASDLEANPVTLVRMYRDWELERVVVVLDDKEFAKHIMIKVEEWELKASEHEATANKLESLVSKLGTFLGGSNA